MTKRHHIPAPGRGAGLAGAPTRKIRVSAAGQTAYAVVGSVGVLNEEEPDPRKGPVIGAWYYWVTEGSDRETWAPLDTDGYRYTHGGSLYRALVERMSGEVAR